MSESEDKINSQRERIRKHILDSCEGEMKEIYADIEKGGGIHYTRKLPLSLFEMHFLPFFKGEIKDEEERTAVETQWIDVAGHIGTPVDIVDNRDIDKVLFTIPALMDGSLFDSDKAHALEFALKQATLHAERSPTNAVHYLIQNKDKIAANLMVDDVEVKKRERWMSFAKYYGLVKSDSENTTGSDNANAAAPELDFEFD